MVDRAEERIGLREVVVSDLAKLFEFQMDPESNSMAAVKPRSEEEFRKCWEAILADRRGLVRAITADGVLVGHISSFKMEGMDAVGYWIAREYWGRGIATRALALFLARVPIRPLHARAARHNVASIRVLERCGFRITGYRMSPATERYLECEEAELILP
jgi:RimJ/RimL family protein N-acetyltransferase